MQITMPRGDYRPVRFKLRNKDGTDLNIDVDEIYITFKKSNYAKDVLFQKKLSSGEITKEEDGYYHFGIMPQDTEELDYNEYYFDIEIYNENPLIKQTRLGKLILTEETTHKENEV